MALESPAWKYTPLTSGYWFPYVGLKRYWISSDVSASGRILEAYRLTGNVIFRFPSAFGTTTWTERDTNVTGSHGVVRYLPNQTIMLVTEASGTIYRRTTSDEGITFSVATTIMDGKYPASCVMIGGTEVHFAVKATGAVNTKALSPQGTVVVAEREVIAAGIAFDSIDCFVRNQRVYLIYRNSSGSIVTVSSTDLLTYT